MHRTAEEKSSFRVLTAEEKARCLDFAKRMCFNAWPSITQRRKESLWSDAEWFLSDALEEGHVGWETGDPEDTFPACDWFDERFESKHYPTYRWEDRINNGDEPKYYRQLCCVCRASLDVVDDMPGGVWGFTIGDFKRMYDGTLPDWFPRDWHKWDDEHTPVNIDSESDDIMLPI